jgi:hypothetical protein
MIRLSVSDREAQAVRGRSLATDGRWGDHESPLLIRGTLCEFKDVDGLGWLGEAVAADWATTLANPNSPPDDRLKLASERHTRRAPERQPDGIGQKLKPVAVS